MTTGGVVVAVGALAGGAELPPALGTQAAPSGVAMQREPCLHSASLEHPPQREFRQRAKGHCKSASLVHAKPLAGVRPDPPLGCGALDGAGAGGAGCIAGPLGEAGGAGCSGGYAGPCIGPGGVGCPGGYCG
ncbi:MAG TPA: hypothetical protein VI072_20105 [Polyangiaceae bacterium]